MSTQHRTADDSSDLEFVDVGDAHAFGADAIAQMPRPEVDPREGDLTLVAVAARGGVEKRDGTLRDAARVLFLCLDGAHAIERVVRNASPGHPGKIPAAVHVDAGAAKIATPSERVVGQHAEALEAHRELEGDR